RTVTTLRARSGHIGIQSSGYCPHLPSALSLSAKYSTPACSMILATHLFAEILALLVLSIPASVFWPAFFAVAMAIFGADHMVAAEFVAIIVPEWMPWRLFWAYFVGFALFAG